MKKAIILNYNTNNLGDDIQTYAAMQLLPDYEFILDRENLATSDIKEEVKFICNGWFMNNPTNWPPAPNLIPLFISFHVSDFNNSSNLMLSDKLLEYYKKHEPIGCRDYHTLRLFKDRGIKAYFSSCLTLTLENKFSAFEKSNNILVVDPFTLYLNNDYKKYIIRKIIPDVKYNDIEYFSHSFIPNENIAERMKNIAFVIEKYSKASLIITSRIHAALPALALGTPVIFIDLGFDSNNFRNRFEGIIDLFNIVDKNFIPFTEDDLLSRIYRKLRIFYFNLPFKNKKFNIDNSNNKQDYVKLYSENIRKTVYKFFNG